MQRNGFLMYVLHVQASCPNTIPNACGSIVVGGEGESWWNVLCPHGEVDLGPPQEWNFPLPLASTQLWLQRAILCKHLASSTVQTYTETRNLGGGGEEGQDDSHKHHVCMLVTSKFTSLA